MGIFSHLLRPFHRLFLIDRRLLALTDHDGGWLQQQQVLRQTHNQLLLQQHPAQRVLSQTDGGSACNYYYTIKGTEGEYYVISVPGAATAKLESSVLSRGLCKPHARLELLYKRLQALRRVLRGVPEGHRAGMRAAGRVSSTVCTATLISHSGQCVRVWQASNTTSRHKDSVRSCIIPQDGPQTCL